MSPHRSTYQRISQEQLQAAVAFHGHLCPGLAIGLRAGELALAEVGAASDEDVVCVSETDMCGVDGIQFLTGCTLGKGNLVLKDFGKIAFSFYRRRDAKGIRLRLRPEALQDPDPAVEALRQRRHSETLTADENALLANARGPQIHRILGLPLEVLFETAAAPGPIPGHAPRLESVPCALCGELVMETRTRRHRGRCLCIPCFKAET